MRSLNLDQLRALKEVDSAGSFSEAARRLNLTQPAVSLQIRELEARWGLRLVGRSGRETRATAAGKKLLEHARRIAEECEAAEAAMRVLRDGWLGRVRIGTTMTALMYDLPPVLKRLRAEHPKIDLVLTNMPTADTVECLVRNTVDLGLVTLPVKSALLKATPLRPQTCVAVLPAGAARIPEVVTPRFLAEHPLILDHERGAVTSLVMGWLAKRLPLSRPPMHVGTIEAAKLAVASGLGVSVVPDVSVADPIPDIIVRPLRPELPCTLGLVERRTRESDPALEIVRTALLGLRTVAPSWGGRRARRLKR